MKTGKETKARDENNKLQHQKIRERKHMVDADDEATKIMREGIQESIRRVSACLENAGKIRDLTEMELATFNVLYEEMEQAKKQLLF